MTGDLSAPHAMLVSHTFVSPRHTTHYLEAGPSTGSLMIFVHGWPEIGLFWRAQIDAFAAAGFRCIAPDMRGYGGSSVPQPTGAYTLQELVRDMLELHDHLGGTSAIWIGHDWGSPVVCALAAHHPDRVRGLALISLPYFPGSFALPSLVPLIDRRLYPAATCPYGQWDYFRFYQTHFESAVADLDADIPATLASIYRSGNPAAQGTPSPSALTTANGGRYGAAHRAPPTLPDPALWPADDFDALVAAFRASGFRSACAWYLNDAANVAYAHAAPDAGRLTMPILFVDSAFDAIAGISGSRLGDPMRATCPHLSIVDIQAGHWAPLERKAEVAEAISAWLQSQGSRLTGQ